ncbi:hypothetical protein ID866_1479 [Astraeus odoratus]|nr:hypothetical protein ID866_1479 [Astraeus odoratus]
MSVRQLRLALRRPLWRAITTIRTQIHVPGTRPFATETDAVRDLKPSNYGQPLFPSHPHLLRPHELTPGIPVEEYERRRKGLMDSLPADSIVISVAAPIKYMSGSFEEPDAAVILEKTSTSRGYRMTLFSGGKDSAKEKWDGARTSFDDVLHIFKADDAMPIHSFPSQLKSLASLYSNIYIDLPNASSKRAPRTVKSLLRYLSPPMKPRSEYESIVDSLSSSRRRPLAPLVAKLRAVKSEHEQQVMRAAADISGLALAKVDGVSSLPMCRTHTTIQDHAIYTPSGYASDITRTFPASGRFTSPQRDLYTAVLTAQKALVELCTEAASLSLHELHRRSCDLLRAELNQLGFQLHAGDLERVLYPHFLGHPIGIDLHESTNFDRGGRLEAGMVITVEPGVCIRQP